MADIKVTNELIDEIGTKCQYYQMEHGLHNSELIGCLEIVKFEILKACVKSEDWDNEQTDN